MDTTKIKKGLGRGLSSLIGETKTEKSTSKILISDLIRNKYQPRKTFDSENLLEFFASEYFIKKNYITETQIPISHSGGVPDIGIYNTEQLLKLLSVTDEDVNVSLSKAGDKSIALKVSDSS